MPAGFIVNDTAPTGVSTSFAVGKIMLMHEDTAEDAKSLHGAMPSSFELCQVDIEVTLTAGGPCSTAQVLFTWDAAGDVVMAGPSAAITLAPAGTTANKYIGSATMLSTSVTATESQTTEGKCYAMLLVDAGTVTVNRIRLHWRDDRYES